MKRISVRSNRIRGRGNYMEDIGKKLGCYLGGKAGSFMSRITGLGEYKISQNTLTNPNNPPVLSNTPAATRIQHREYLGDIKSSVDFSLTSYPINPGLPTTFPWLSGPAGSFEQYRLHGLVFEFKSTSAVALNSTNTALGTVIMATEYNVVDSPFLNKRAMENHMYSTSSPPSISALHPIECARDVSVLSDLFVRGNGAPVNADLRFSDFGNFQIATVGMQQSDVTIGELWCTYDVELMKTSLPDAYTSNTPCHFQWNTALGGTVPVYNSLFTDTSGNQLLRTMGVGAKNVTLQGNNVIFSTPGRYMIRLDVTCTSSPSSTIVVTYAGQTNAVSLFYADSSGGGTPFVASYTTTSLFRSVVSAAVDVSGPGSAGNLSRCFFTASSTAFPGTIQAVDLLVIPLPNGFSSSRGTFESLRESEQILQLRDCLEMVTSQLKILAKYGDDDSDIEDEHGIHVEPPLTSTPESATVRLSRSAADLLLGRGVIQRSLLSSSTSKQ